MKWTVVTAEFFCICSSLPFHSLWNVPFPSSSDWADCNNKGYITVHTAEQNRHCEQGKKYHFWSRFPPPISLTSVVIKLLAKTSPLLYSLIETESNEENEE